MSDDKEGNAALSERLLSGEVDPEANIVVDSTVERGEKQPSAYRDLWAAILFGIKQIVILYLAIAWGLPNLNYEYSSYGSNDEVHFQGALLLCLCSGLVSLLLSLASLSVMVRVGEQLIQATLVASLALNAFITLVFLIRGYLWAMLLSGLILVWGILYAKAVWKRIPFTAANLKAALTALQLNGGISIIAIIMTGLVYFWSFLWVLSVIGVYAKSATCENGACSAHMNGLLVIFFLLSYYWTTEVAKNMLHVTVSGLVGTWFFSPLEASSFCSPAITDSFARASTYSFGSICLGSLMTAILQTLYHLLHEARRNRRGGHFLLCVLECIVACLESLISYFNRYTMVYVGLWGYDYLTAGKRVMNLFSQRGWTTIINDDLVIRVLSWMALVLGGLSGCFGLLLAVMRPSWVEEFGDASMFVAFVLPAILGTAIATILMGVVSSAVDTMIVAFAESPADFERNHPGYHRQMVDAWRLVYPNEFRL